jgi:hypothetical protein
MLAQLRRLVHVDLRAEHRHAQGEPFEVVVGGPVLAAPLVDRRQRAAEVGEPGGELAGRRVDGDARLEAADGAGEALLDEGDGVGGRQRPGREPHAGRGRGVQPVHAERAPVGAAAVPGDEVPPAPEVHERVGLDLAAARGAVAAAVGEPEALGVAAGGGDGGEVLGIDRRPARGTCHRRGGEGGDAAPQVLRQHLLELDERTDRGLLDPGHGRARRGAQPDGDGDRLVLVEQQRRHGAPRAQPVAARRAGERLHRIAEAAQPLHVAPDGAPGHLEALRELGARPVATALEQGEEGQEAAGGLTHGGGRRPTRPLRAVNPRLRTDTDLNSA